MSTKHITNETGMVLDALRGLVAKNGELALNAQYKVISRKQVPRDRVTILSGGGAGHEPSHAAMVGRGLLSAAVSGNVFASPNTNQIKKGLELIDNDKGILMVIPQYTGDVLHFGLAKEQYAAANPGSNVRILFVGEDVSVGRSQGSMVGRRGLAGAVLVYKLAGALADKGKSVDDVYQLARFVVDSTATLGVGLDHCHIPGTGPSEHTLKPDEMELGMGIHNEPGVKRIKIPSARELLTQMVDFATDTVDKDRSFVPFKHDGSDEVVLMINNLGGTSELEMGGITSSAMEACKAKGLKVRRLLVGTYVTSLNMPGFSITLLRLPGVGEDAPYSAAELLELVDAPADAPGWAWHSKAEPGQYDTPSGEANTSGVETADHTVAHTVENVGKPLAPASAGKFISAIERACKDIIAAEPELTRFDTIAGDGDCGLCLEAGGKGILRAIADGRVSDKDVISAVLTMAEQIEIDMDGTSGALYSIAFNGLASGLRRVAEEKGTDVATADVWAGALVLAKETLYTYTRARAPSRTMVDPLEAFISTFAAKPADFAGAVKAAVEAAAATATYEAKAGRAAYVDRQNLRDAQVPDPGAHGVGILLRGILGALEG